MFKQNPFEDQRAKEIPKMDLRVFAANVSKYWKDGKDPAPEFSEDAIFQDLTTRTFGVFDGMGGHSGGKEASRGAARAYGKITANWEKFSAEEVEKKFPQAVHVMHRILTALGERLKVDRSDAGFRRLGTTACLARFAHDEQGHERAVITNVGDSRAYLFRDGRMKRLTTDRHVYLGAGIEDAPDVEVVSIVMHPQDKLLLTSDGILKNLTEEAMELILKQAEKLGKDPSLLLTDTAYIFQVQKILYDHSRNGPMVDSPSSNRAPVINRDDFSAIVIECVPSIQRARDDEAEKLRIRRELQEAVFALDTALKQSLEGAIQRASDETRDILRKEFQALAAHSDARARAIVEMAAKNLRLGCLALFGLERLLISCKELRDGAALRSILSQMTRKIQTILTM